MYCSYGILEDAAAKIGPRSKAERYMARNSDIPRYWLLWIYHLKDEQALLIHSLKGHFCDARSIYVVDYARPIGIESTMFLRDKQDRTVAMRSIAGSLQTSTIRISVDHQSDLPTMMKLWGCFAGICRCWGLPDIHGKTSSKLWGLVKG
jgi:hypothetical protein